MIRRIVYYLFIFVAILAIGMELAFAYDPRMWLVACFLVIGWTLKLAVSFFARKLREKRNNPQIVK